MCDAYVHQVTLRAPSCIRSFCRTCQGCSRFRCASNAPYMHRVVRECIRICFMLDFFEADIFAAIYKRFKILWQYCVWQCAQIKQHVVGHIINCAVSGFSKFRSAYITHCSKYNLQPPNIYTARSKLTEKPWRWWSPELQLLHFSFPSSALFRLPHRLCRPPMKTKVRSAILASVWRRNVLF